MRRFEVIVVYNVSVKDKLNTELVPDDEIMASLVNDLEGTQSKRDFFVQSRCLQIKRVDNDRT